MAPPKKKTKAKSKSKKKKQNEDEARDRLRAITIERRLCTLNEECKKSDLDQTTEAELFRRILAHMAVLQTCENAIWRKEQFNDMYWIAVLGMKFTYEPEPGRSIYEGYRLERDFYKVKLKNSPEDDQYRVYLDELEKCLAKFHPSTLERGESPWPDKVDTSSGNNSSDDLDNVALISGGDNQDIDAELTKSVSDGIALVSSSNSEDPDVNQTNLLSGQIVIGSSSNNQDIDAELTKSFSDGIALVSSSNSEDPDVNQTNLFSGQMFIGSSSNSQVQDHEDHDAGGGPPEVDVFYNDEAYDRSLCSFLKNTKGSGQEVRMLLMLSAFDPISIEVYRAYPQYWINTCRIVLAHDHLCKLEQISDNFDFLSKEKLIIEDDGSVCVEVKRHRSMKTMMDLGVFGMDWFWLIAEVHPHATTEYWKTQTPYQALYRPTPAFQNVIRTIVRGLAFLFAKNIRYDVSPSSVVFLEDDVLFNTPKLSFTFQEGDVQLKDFFGSLKDTMEMIMSTHGLATNDVAIDVGSFISQLGNPKSMSMVTRHPVMWERPSKIRMYSEWYDANRFGEFQDGLVIDAGQDFVAKYPGDWGAQLLAHPLLEAKLKRKGPYFVTQGLDNLLVFIRDVHAHVNHDQPGTYAREQWTEADVNDIFELFLPKLGEVLIAFIGLKDGSLKRFERFSCER